MVLTQEGCDAETYIACAGHGDFYLSVVGCVHFCFVYLFCAKVSVFALFLKYSGGCVCCFIVYGFVSGCYAWLSGSVDVNYKCICFVNLSLEKVGMCS